MMVPNISDVSQLLNSNSKIKQFCFVSFDPKFNSGRGNLNSIVVFCLSKIVCKHENISLHLSYVFSFVYNSVET